MLSPTVLTINSGPTTTPTRNRRPPKPVQGANHPPPNTKVVVVAARGPRNGQIGQRTRALWPTNHHSSRPRSPRLSRYRPVPLPTLPLVAPERKVCCRGLISWSTFLLVKCLTCLF